MASYVSSWPVETARTCHVEESINWLLSSRQHTVPRKGQFPTVENMFEFMFGDGKGVFLIDGKPDNHHDRALQLAGSGSVYLESCISPESADFFGWRMSPKMTSAVDPFGGCGRHPKSDECCRERGDKIHRTKNPNKS